MKILNKKGNSLIPVCVITTIVFLLLSVMLTYIATVNTVFRQKDKTTQILDNYLAFYSILVYNTIKQGDNPTDIYTSSLETDVITALGFTSDMQSKTDYNANGKIICTMSRPTVETIDVDGVGLVVKYTLIVPLYIGGAKLTEITVPIETTSTFQRK